MVKVVTLDVRFFDVSLRVRIVLLSFIHFYNNLHSLTPQSTLLAVTELLIKLVTFFGVTADGK